ncbi:MAG: tetratricopeptide repeat protein [Polyangiaceae bacterium]|nr:tetratricopeptide repeat protein [Polyangiaceae bacterium]
MNARALAALLVLGVACAPALPQSFAEQRSAAERAYAAGRYDEAADHWAKAEAAAKRRRDQTEARYRRAAALRRAGRHEDARRLLEELERTRPRSARAARAAFERADIEIETGNAERGFAELEAAIRKYPRSGLALGALARLARQREERAGAEAALALLAEIGRTGGSNELRERALFDRARLLEKLGRDTEALAAFLDAAARFPYPEGALWDDALHSASVLEEKLGRPDRAIAHLERMLREKEPSSLKQGSYERPRYAAARYRVAELYRDRIGDKARATREFRRVWDEHPTSLLKDDALWQAARIERERGRSEAACELLEVLRSDAPDSRFAACATALCPTLPRGKAECHDYVLRDLDPKQDH